MRALIVDDEKNNRLLLEEIIEDCGIDEVDFAEDGQEAYKRLLKVDYDVAFMDYNLPIMNGREVVEKVYEEKPNGFTSVVMVTGSAYHDKKELDHPMIKGWIRKPLNIDRVKKVLSAIGEDNS